jgi:transcriptional regulator with XRE-family HTH domain
VLDCFTHGKGASSPVFTGFYGEPQPDGRPRVVLLENPGAPESFIEVLYGLLDELGGVVRLVFDSMTGMQELWGGEKALGRFYSHSCPRLYELDTIAYWILEKEAHTQQLKAKISQVAQVVIELSIKRGRTSLTVIKADEREVEDLQKPLAYWSKDDRIGFVDRKRASGDLNLGQRVKELRLKNNFSQTDLAKQIGVTPSTISQVESNLIYPSLPALLKMAEVMRVGPGSFFHDETRRGWAKYGPGDYSEMNPANLPSESGWAVRLAPVDFEGRAEPCLLEIRPGAQAAGHFFVHKGEEIGCLLEGSLEMEIDSEIVHIQPGDVIHCTYESPTAWRNIGDEPARLLWFMVR